MKQFLQISSNQITAYNPDKKSFRLMSEIVLSAIETEYNFVRNESKEGEVLMHHETETFRFFATAEALKIMRDRIDEEIKFQEKLLKTHKAE